MGSIEYGYRGKGYWDTLKCMRESAPKLAAALIRIHGTRLDPRATLSIINEIARKGLNRFHHHFN